MEAAHAGKKRSGSKEAKSWTFELKEGRKRWKKQLVHENRAGGAYFQRGFEGRAEGEIRQHTHRCYTSSRARQP